MKTIEEKAKRYDEAIKVAKEWHTDTQIGIGFKANLEKLFPELKESEDERIRKVLIGWINLEPSISFGDTFDGFSKEQILAWLEKQGEDKPVISDNALREGIAHFGITQYQIDNWLKKYVDVEKQGEHKPADKVEAKFKVGDWITNGHATCQITFIDSRYWYSETCVLGNVIDIDKTFHLWTIQDAKDRDILVSFANQPFIYNGSFTEFFVGAYCGLTIHGTFVVGGGECNWTFNKDIKPATKEQRDQLEKAMADAGYTFDFEKKALKKIEQKSATMSLDEAIEHCKEKSCGNNACALEHKQLEKWLTELKELKEQKPTWNDDDERNLGNAIWYVENPVPMVVKDSMLVEWLKSLKGRVGNFDDGYKVGVSAAKHNQWKPSGEQMKALHDLNLTGNLSYAGQGQVLIDLYNALKNLI